MTVEEWFESRDAAYAAFEAVEDDPLATQNHIDAAWQRFHDIRKLLNLWKRSETDEWRAQWRAAQNVRIGGLLEDLRGEQPWRQDGLEDSK